MMNTIIYYFSATGNSLQTAKIIAEKLDATLLSMPSQTGADCRADRIGFVFPTYFFGLPRTVAEFIANLNIEETDPYLFAVTTYGGMHGGVLGSLDRLLEQKGFRLRYGKEIQSVANFIEEYNPKFRMKAKIIENAKTRAAQAAREISSGDINGPFRYFIWDQLFYKIYTNRKLNQDQGFHVDDTCIQCGICQNICPNQNIVVKDHVLSFQHRCEHCVACINCCPQNAIQWKNSTQNRVRYKNPEIPVQEIISGMQKPGRSIN